MVDGTPLSHEKECYLTTRASQPTKHNKQGSTNGRICDICELHEAMASGHKEGEHGKSQLIQRFPLPATVVPQGLPAPRVQGCSTVIVFTANLEDPFAPAAWPAILEDFPRRIATSAQNPRSLCPIYKLQKVEFGFGCTLVG